MYKMLKENIKYPVICMHLDKLQNTRNLYIKRPHVKANAKRIENIRYSVETGT